MKDYDITIEDIFDKDKSKKFKLKEGNVFLAHKGGLKSCNALREEIVRISSNGKTLFTLRSGFLTSNE